MNQRDFVLNKRYELTTEIDMPGIQSSELWEATNKDSELQTLKITPYHGEKPSPEVRRVWDNDMRVMYRLSSSAGADEQLVVMTDAGIDYAAQAMVLVYEGRDYVSLSQLIEKQKRPDWLSFQKLKDRNVRRELWRAFHRLALGLSLLHDQHLIHRNVLPEAIWGRKDEGPEALRLSGFDWSARLGHASSKSIRTAWCTPPELEHVGYSFASDWYGFGTTVARCFYNVENLKLSPEKLANELHTTILRENPCQLSELERNFIRSLVAPDRFDRQQQSSAIVSGIEDIIEGLDISFQARKGNRSVLLYIDCSSPKIIEAIQDSGFVVNPEDPFDPFDPTSPQHRTQLKDFLTSLLRKSSLVWNRNGSQFELNSGTLFIVCDKWMNSSTKEQSWVAAKAKYFNRTSRFQDSIPASQFNDARIEVEFGVKEVYSKIDSRADYASWGDFAPKEGIYRGLGKDSEHLQQFLHLSNQFEILLRDAELFKYKIVYQDDQDGFSKIGITEIVEERDSRRYFNAKKKLTDFFQQEIDSGKNYCDQVLLTESDSLFVSRAGASGASERFDVDKEQWKIDDIDHNNELVFLKRRIDSTLNSTPIEGYVRTRGHYGQIRLIERRKNSIDRLASHSYLLRAMATPNLTRIDAGESPLPFPQIEQDKIIDENKIAIVKDILRTRPAYGLQGPPGTGKSTLVAHLLRQILEEDPMAQILVTAKDHDAVDVLAAKVIREAFKGESKERVPLAVRLARRDGKDHAEELVKDLTHNALTVLKDHPPKLDNCDHQEIQKKWIKLLESLSDYINKRDDSAQSTPKTSEYLTIFESIRNLVRQGASITYCTTSSGDLEELAKGAHSFDWSIVEEAGKTHGFDLALPLQAGHRWLLLGDHKQLRPFLYDEFVKCVDQLEDAVSILDEIKSKRGNDRIVDIDWISKLLDAEKEGGIRINSFKKFANTWLASFATIFEKFTKIKGDEEITQNDSVGASAGRLNMQYRMPPVVGDLISSVFYNDRLRNGTDTDEGKPDDDHNNPCVEPQWIAGQSLIWLDTPWKNEYESYRKTGYSNKGERQVIIDFLKRTSLATKLQPSKPYTVAVLTPYNMQKYEINKEKDLNLPSGCQFGSSQDRTDGSPKAYSVDSFQGNEADVVVVSLVRNELPKDGKIPSASDIEFITQPDRLNVMLSRSVRLLVIVGCWDYLSKCVADVSSARDEQDEFVDRKFGPFKKTLETLEQFFKDGRALRISVDGESRK